MIRGGRLQKTPCSIEPEANDNVLEAEYERKTDNQITKQMIK